MVFMKLALFFALVACLHAAKLPSYIKPCSLSDPALAKCAIKHGQEALPSIVKGDAAYKIPKMTPLKISEIKFSTGDLNIKLTNAVITGFEDAVIKDIKVDLKNQKLEFVVSLERANLLSDYSIDGKIMILPIKGQGPANITFVGGVYQYGFQYNLKEKDGKRYITLVDSHLKYTTQRSYYHFDNLFGGNTALGNQMNQFLNENWKEVQRDVGPALSQTIEAIITNIVTGIYSSVPFDDIFLP